MILSTWTSAFLATAVISTIPNLLLVFLPEKIFLQDDQGVRKNDGKKKTKLNIGKMLVMFSVAGLLGDVFLHALPHILNDHAHHHEVDAHPKLANIRLSEQLQSESLAPRRIDRQLSAVDDVPTSDHDHRDVHRGIDAEHQHRHTHSHDHHRGHEDHDHDHDHHQNVPHKSHDHDHDGHDHDHEHHVSEHHDHTQRSEKAAPHESHDHDHDHDHSGHDHRDHDHSDRDHNEHDHDHSDRHSHAPVADHHVEVVDDHHDHDHKHDHHDEQKLPAHHDHDHGHSHSNGDHKGEHHSHSQDHGHDHDHDHGHDDGHGHSHGLTSKGVWVPLLVLLGFLVFYLTDKSAQLWFDSDDDHAEKEHDHDHRHAHGHGHHHHHMKASGWLNLVADTMHNFTDGITIGVAFTTGSGLAIATFVSVLIHELPHELSDFTVLLRSGVSKWNAIRLQFVTAIGAMLGTAVGLYLAEDNKFVQDVVGSLTAGGFVYIAAVSLTPEILRDSRNEPFLQVIGEALCFAAGVALMVVVGFMEAH